MRIAGRRQAGLSAEMERDIRPEVIAFLKRLTLLAFALAVAGYTYAYREDINVDNAKRLLSYIRAGVAAGGAPFTEAGFSLRDASGYAAFRGGIALLDGDMLRFINAAGREDFTAQLMYPDPECVAADKLLLVYSRGGRQLCITNSYAKIFEKTFDGDIVSASMAKSGAFAVVTGREEYRSAIAVFDSGHNEVFRLSTADYYIASASLSPDETHLAAAAFSPRDGAFRSDILFYKTDSEEKPLSVSFNESYLFDQRFLSDDRLCVIAENGLRVLDLSGKTVYERSFQSGELVAYAFSDGGYAAVLLKDGEAENACRLFVAREDGMSKGGAAVNGEIKGISAAGDYIALVADDRLCGFSPLPEALGESVPCAGILDALARPDGSAIALFGDRAQVFSLKK